MTPPFRLRLSTPWKMVLGALAISLLALYAVAWHLARPVASPAPDSTLLFDRSGALLGALVATDGQWRANNGSASVPERFQICLLQVEDRHFLTHPGIHIPSLVRAARANRRAGRVVQGGSTITMQIARMRVNGPRTLWNKVMEMLMAIGLEARHDKAALLRMYTTMAPFGGNVVGSEAAAWRWFGHPASELSWAEAATLAVLPNAPGLIHPGKGRPQLRARRDRLLDHLREHGLIDSITWTLAKEEPLPDRPTPMPREAPHLLATLATGGAAGQPLRSTLDGYLQRRANQVLAAHADRLRADQIHHAAALVMDVATGEVIAYVGNIPTDGASHGDQVDMVQAPRSTGSILKPFLHADRLHHGALLPEMLVADIPTHYAGFSPRNADETFRGALPASEALARSLNVPAVRSLEEHGVDRTLRLLRAMGITSLARDAEHYGLSLIIGGGEASLWEITGAYASLGRTLLFHGSAPPLGPGNEVHAPRILVDRPPPRASACPLGAGSIHATLHALRSVARPPDESGWQHFAQPRQVAWKTGTSQGHRDAWAVGLTDRFCVGVWAGNASGEGRPGLTGARAAAPILFDLLGLLPAGGAYPVPHDDLISSPICARSGHRAGPDCMPVDTLLVPRAGGRSAVCPYHHIIRLDASGRHRVRSGGTPTTWFILPPAMEERVAVRDARYIKPPPLRAGEEDDGLDEIELLYPTPGARLLLARELDGERGRFLAEAACRFANERLHWHLDGVFMASTQGRHSLALSLPAGAHTLLLTNDRGRTVQRSFTVVAPNLPDP